MIKELTIRNFKAIKDLKLQFTPMTILIGENSCGKSTVLQALDFLASITYRDIDEYLKDRDWSYDEIKSKFAGAEDSISFLSSFEFSDHKLFWEIDIKNEADKWIIKEQITDKINGECLLSSGYGDDRPHEFSMLNIKSSALKMIGHNLTADFRLESLDRLKQTLNSIQSLELLTPEIMRNRDRNPARRPQKNIGRNGEKLYAYIDTLSDEQKIKMNAILSELIGYEVCVDTEYPFNNEVELKFHEGWGNGAFNIKGQYISDGLLRLIAYVAIIAGSGNKNNHLPAPVYKEIFLIDEIEDGINPEITEKLINTLKGFIRETGCQIIVTSHSPVILNYFDDDSIQFMWRDELGIIRAKPMFQTKAMKEHLDYMNPGEIWLNFAKETILEKLTELPV